jgi:hypothetical protein
VTYSPPPGQHLVLTQEEPSLCPDREHGSASERQGLPNQSLEDTRSRLW